MTNYIILRKEEITSDMLSSISSSVVTSPNPIYLIDPPEGEPGGILSDYLYITTEEEYPSAFQFYRKLTEEEFNSLVTKIKQGNVPKYKITDSSDQDVTGRPIFRTAATVKGWHYQAHSLEWQTSQLNSVYNKDDEETDLGFTTIKFYNSSGTELTTQLDIDSGCVKTVVEWKPTFDFEIISGNVRQESKQNTNMYTHVAAMIPTGLPAPHNWLKIPFTQGGINLKYIGADETLKTDGRASKLLPASQGAYFKIVINHDAGVKHEMSIIFEIYKDPTT